MEDLKKLHGSKYNDMESSKLLGILYLKKKKYYTNKLKKHAQIIRLFTDILTYK